MAKTDQEKLEDQARADAEKAAADAAEANAAAEARVAADAKVAAEAQANQDPPVDPTSETAGAVHPKRKSGNKITEQTAANHDVVRQYEDEPSVPLGAGVSEDRRPRVPYGVTF